jgi:hypothetical protein
VGPGHLGRAARLSVVVVAVAAAACGSDSGPDSGSPTEITGVVVDVDSRGLGDVRGFTVRSDGDTYDISIDPDASYGFPLTHLTDHLASAEPVRVELDERGSELVATAIEDA